MIPVQLQPAAQRLFHALGLNEGVVLTARRATSIALSTLTAFISFVYLPWQDATAVSAIVIPLVLAWGFECCPGGVMPRPAAIYLIDRPVVPVVPWYRRAFNWIPPMRREGVVPVADPRPWSTVFGPDYPRREVVPDQREAVPAPNSAGRERVGDAHVARHPIQQGGVDPVHRDPHERQVPFAPGVVAQGVGQVPRAGNVLPPGRLGREPVEGPRLRREVVPGAGQPPQRPEEHNAERVPVGHRMDSDVSQPPSVHRSPPPIQVQLAFGVAPQVVGQVPRAGGNPGPGGDGIARVPVGQPGRRQ
jgi:hypothetical protein